VVLADLTSPAAATAIATLAAVISSGASYDEQVILAKRKARHQDLCSQVLQYRPDRFHGVLRLLELSRHRL